MSNPEVKIQDGNEQHEKWWIKYLPVERTGRKLTIHSKKMFWWLAGTVLFVATSQIVLDTNVDVPSRGTISSPDTVSENNFESIPEATISEINGFSGRRSNGGISVRLAGLQVISRPRNLALIPPGSFMEAKLASGASNGLVRAEVSKALSVNGDIVIPEGAFLVGSGSSSEDRLFVRFSQVVFKDGTFGNLNAEACDQSDKIVGLKGSKVGNKALQLTGSLGLGFLGGFSTALQDTKGQQGAVVSEPSLKNALLNGTATTALEESKNMMQDLKNRQPIIEVPQGTSICVMVSGGG